MNRNQTLRVRISSALKNDLQLLADLDRRTLSALCEKALHEYVHAQSANVLKEDHLAAPSTAVAGADAAAKREARKIVYRVSRPARRRPAS
jgi:hypothetical protein